jgi:hypothetical protein
MFCQHLSEEMIFTQRRKGAKKSFEARKRFASLRLCVRIFHQSVHFHTGISGITKLLIHIYLVATLKVVVSPYVSINPPRSTNSRYSLPVCPRPGS